MPRRVISNITRSVAPIHRCSWRIRTFHGPRLYSVDGVREPFTLDRVVAISLPLIHWLGRGAT